MFSPEPPIHLIKEIGFDPDPGSPENQNYHLKANIPHGNVIAGGDMARAHHFLSDPLRRQLVILLVFCNLLKSDMILFIGY